MNSLILSTATRVVVPVMLVVSLFIFWRGHNDPGGGFVGGAQAGYNYQFGMFVAGAETDLQYAAVGNKGASYGTIYYPGESDGFFGTIRARAGVAFDRALVYGTGGFAYGGGSNPVNASIYTGTLPGTFRTGWTAGGGVEYAVTERSRRIELRHLVLALLERPEPDPAAALLSRLGVDAARARSALLPH